MFRPARHVRTMDGDSFVLWIARHGHFEHRGGVDRFRILGVRAREKYQGAEYGPGDELLRMSGKDAAAWMDGVLSTAKLIEAEEVGLDDWGRILANVRVDGADLAERMLSARVAVRGSTMGVHVPVAEESE